MARSARRSSVATSSPSCGTQARGDDLEERVADVVAERVVDGLEVVEVEEEKRAALLVPARMRDRLARALGEHRPVRQPGQRVVVREEFQPARVVLELDGGVAQVLLRALELRDVVR